MKDLEKYKRDIALPDFLIQHYNFVPDDGSSACYPKLKNKITSQVIVVSLNKKGNYTYFDVHNDRIKGCSILDFMQQAHTVEGKAPSLYQVAQILDNFIKSGKIVAPDKSRYYITKNDNELSALLSEVHPLKDYEFLISRGISKDTLETDLFKNTFFEREFLSGETVFHNTVIKMINKEGTSGISQRNAMFKGCVGSRYDALGVAMQDNQKPVDIYFIGESMLDAVSHYELNHDRLKDKNVVYFSSEGSLTMGQIELFQQTINYKVPANIVSLFDNDIAGQEYNLKLFGNIIFDGRGEGITTEVLSNDKGSLIEIEITMPNSIANRKQEALPSNFFSESINGNVSFDVENRCETAIWKIGFPRTFENVNAFVNKLKVFRLGNAQAYRQIPLTNDFNDDLRAKKGIHKDWTIEKDSNGVLKGIRIPEKKSNLEMVM